MFSLRSSVLRMAVVVAAIVAVAGSTPGLRHTAGDATRLEQQQQGARILQESNTPAPSAPATMDEAEMMSFAPTPAAPATDAPTAAPSTAEREIELDDDEDDVSGAASWAPSSLLSPAAIFVGSVAAAVALV